MKSLWLSLLFFSQVSFSGDNCAQKVAKVLSLEAPQGLSEPLRIRTVQSLGRPLTVDQQKALKQVIDETPLDSYLATEIEAQSRKLRKAGFTDLEIDRLRTQKILVNSKITIPKGAPVGVTQKAVALKEFDSAALQEIKQNKKYNYVASESGEIYLTEQKLDFPKDQLAMISRSNGPEGSFMAREMGEVGYDPKKRTVVFKPKHGFENNELASKAMTDKVSKLAPNTQATVAAEALKVPSTRLIKCLDIVSSQSNGKNFVLDRVIADNMVLTTAVLGSELAGANRLSTPEGRAVIAGDLIGTTITSAIGARVGKEFVLRDFSFVTSMGVRTGMGLGMIEVQEQVHKQVLAKESQQLAEDLAAFNQAHFIARLPVNHYFDKFLVQSLPNLIFNSCQRNPALSVMVSPRAIRLYERYGSAVLYYGLRDHFVENKAAASAQSLSPAALSEPN